MTRRLLGLSICALLVAAGFAVPGQRRPRVELIPPQSVERVAETPTSRDAHSLAPSTTSTSRVSRGTVRPFLPPSTRPAGVVITAKSGDLVHRIATCESGQRPTAVNRSSGAGGLMQWLPSTWRSMGYAGRYGVSRAELLDAGHQWEAAYDAVARYGTRPWASSRRCWG